MDDLVLNVGRLALFEKPVEVHARPQAWDKRVALLGVAQRNPGAERHRLVALLAGDDDFALLIAALRLIAPQDDLLGTRGEVGQLAWINPGDGQPLELHLEIAERGRR